MTEDPYRVLGVTPAASAEELRRAHRRMIRLTHPDLGGSAAAFRSVQHAWEAILGESVSASRGTSDSRYREEDAARRHRAGWAAEQEARRVAEEWKIRTAAYMRVVDDLPRRYQGWVQLGAGFARARAWRRFDLIALGTEAVLVLAWSGVGLAFVRFGTAYLGIDLLAVLLFFTCPLMAILALVELARLLSRHSEIRRDTRPHLSPEEVYAKTPPMHR